MMEGEELRLLFAEDPTKKTTTAGEGEGETTSGVERNALVGQLLEGKYDQVVLESEASKSILQALKDNDDGKASFFS